MKNALIIPALIAFFIISCSTGKIINQDEAQNIILKKEVANLIDQNTELYSRVYALNKKVDSFKIAGDQNKNELEAVRSSGTVAISRFNEISNCLEEESDSLLQIKRRAIKGLSNFDKSLVNVKYQNGMVYISMQDQFMFSSGSAKINPGGMKALSVIAEILFDYDHVTAIVVGNTDTTDMKVGFTDNWSLSTERSNTIVRYLISHYRVNPARLIAAGKSKFSPVATNDTPEGRAKNRRTDIIFNPDLKKLWLLSQKYP